MRSTRTAASSTEELTERLILAKRCVPFVQANLIETPLDDPSTVGQWREEMRAYGIWANDPVPLFPYPGSPDYRKLWGAARRSGVGAGARVLPRPVPRLQRDPGRAAAADRRAGSESRLMLARHLGAAPARVLMTVDAVGGVWRYALELARGLTQRGYRSGPGDHGAAGHAGAARRGRRRSDGVRGGPRLVRSGVDAGADDDVLRAGAWLMELEATYAPDLVHLNGYAHAALPWRAPVVVVAHSCVLSWWRAVHGEEAPARVGRLPPAHRSRAARCRPGGGADTRFPAHHPECLWSRTSPPG